jgi:hypothetical protein
VLEASEIADIFDEADVLNDATDTLIHPQILNDDS